MCSADFQQKARWTVLLKTLSLFSSLIVEWTWLDFEPM